MRHNASEMNLKTRLGNSSSLTLAVPGTGITTCISASTTTTITGPTKGRSGSGDGLRPGTPKRPGTANSKKKEWANPFDIHFGRDSIGSQPGTPITGPAKTSLERFEFGVGYHERTNSNGYPSPPNSIDSSTERSIPPSYSENNLSTSRRTGPSALRIVDTAGPTALPSPAASVIRKSEETGDGPVIKNVAAKRDTLTFQSLRRPSSHMEIEIAAAAAAEADKARENEEAQKHKTDEDDVKLLVEGLMGNFAGFDFGESVRRSSLASTMSRNHYAAKRSFDSTSIERGVSPTDMRRPATSYTRKDHSIDFSKPKPLPKQLPMLTAEEKRVSRGRNDSETLASAPLDLMPETPPSLKPKPKPSPISKLPPQLPPPRGLPPSAPLPQTPLAPRPQTAAAAVGPSGFITGMKKLDLDPPPRGFRSRIDSNPRARDPPSGLRVPPPLATQVKGSMPSRSPYGPPPEEGNYMRSEGSPRPPAPIRSQSPLCRPPLEGDFPIHKGLPRGRRPPTLPDSPQQPVRPSRDLAATREQGSKSSSEEEQQDDSLTLPNWDEFDRTDGAGNNNINSPRWNDYYSPITSDTPPQLPSPSFPSLEKSISLSSENLRRAFESYDKPLISPVMGEFPRFRERSPASIRVKAKKAPPRPSPITLPPSTSPSIRSPTSTADSFSPGFI